VPKSFAVKDILSVLLCVMSLTALFYVRFEPYWPVAISLCSLLCIALLRGRRQHLLPAIVIILLLKILEFILLYFVSDSFTLFYLLAVSALDLGLAFMLANFYRAHILLRWCRVALPVPELPQVFLMAILLACSSLYNFLMAAEVMLYYADASLYQDSVPWFYRHSGLFNTIFSLSLHLLCWMLLLTPERWRWLHAVQRWSER
jgi:hypothetical protein